MISVARGRLRGWLAADAAVAARALALRAVVFRQGAPDRDGFDEHALHGVVEGPDGAVLAAFRVLVLPEGGIGAGYSAQVYDLGALDAWAGPVVELGRFCTAAGGAGPDVLRLALGLIARAVDDHGATLLCGCSSFAGQEPARHAGALAALRAHVGPARWLPRRRGPVMEFPDAGPQPAALPPLLRTYLQLGGWVSDFAVQDPDLDTLHVFTAVEVASIPPARARALRAVLG